MKRTRASLSSARRFAGLASLLAAAAGLWGCSLVQFIAPAGEAPAPLESPAPLQSPDAAPLPTQTLPPSVTPTDTPAPTFTALPSYTLAPSLTPQPSATLPPVVVLPTFPPPATPTFNPRGTSYPYTLRVFNRGKENYWIGTHPPYLGNCIKPDKYIEFYLTAPQAIKVYWCQANCRTKNLDRLYTCQNRTVSVVKTLTVADIPK